MAHTIPLIFGLGTTEIILIVLVVLLLFGGRKIPELMKGLGKGMKSFKDGIAGTEEDLNVNDTYEGGKKNAKKTAAHPPENGPTPPESPAG